LTIPRMWSYTRAVLSLSTCRYASCSLSLSLSLSLSVSIPVHVRVKNVSHSLQGLHLRSLPFPHPPLFRPSTVPLSHSLLLPRSLRCSASVPFSGACILTLEISSSLLYKADMLQGRRTLLFTSTIVANRALAHLDGERILVPCWRCKAIPETKQTIHNPHGLGLRTRT
jgi:hypothetical protein